MTLNAHKALEDYFHVINQPKKEITMMLKLSMWFTEQLENFKNIWTKPTTFEDNRVFPDFKDYEDGYWSFEMYTPEWVDEFGETVKPVHTCFITSHDGAWMEVLDRILDAMEVHYGYNIKEQVYYSVNFPFNIEGEAGYGRSLNDVVLQKLLLSYPEVYTVTKESYE